MTDVQQQVKTDATATKNAVRTDIASAPIKAVLIAAGTGVVIGLLVDLLFHI